MDHAWSTRFWAGYTKLSGSFNKVVTEARELLPLLRDFRYRG
jgi:hypothetical protein